MDRKQFIQEFDHFCSTINYKKSALDCKAIQFMNEFNFKLDDMIITEIKRQVK